MDDKNQTLTRVNEKFTNLGMKVNAMDEGIKTAVSRINEDLVALDQRIDRHQDECEWTEDKLCVAKGKIEVLEECLKSQWELFDQLMNHINDMEGILCCCGKGKKQEILEEIPSVLDSPLVLGDEVNDRTASDDSYHMPPVAGSSQSPSSVTKSDKENVMVLYDSWESRLVEIMNDPSKNVMPIPVREPSLDFSGISRLIAVCGQCAVRTLGRPKLTFHPYTFCCRLGRRSSTHRPSSLCIHPKTEVGERLL